MGPLSRLAAPSAAKSNHFSPPTPTPSSAAALMSLSVSRGKVGEQMECHVGYSSNTAVEENLGAGKAQLQHDLQKGQGKKKRGKHSLWHFTIGYELLTSVYIKELPNYHYQQC
jgi:hypothetical protein